MTNSIEAPDFQTLVRVFGHIGLVNFGGPAGQIALMHKELVDERGWISEDDFLQALNFCHLLPGPEAQQLATYIGWKLHGVRGGLAAGLLFIIPGALVILALSILYAHAAQLDWFAALFLGIKAAVLSIVLQALLRIAGRSLDTLFKKLLAAAAFVALAGMALPFPLVILSALLLGIIVALRKPEWLALKATSTAPITTPPPTLAGTARTILMWMAIWAAPMILLALTLGRDHELWKIGSFFSQLAVVTFGGAYAVLAYMAQEAVQGFGWLAPGEMADGLGLAETTPGPLIMVTQFVGFLAAFRAPEPFSPLVAGLVGAALTSWVTFAPCFLWIFTFAPWLERMQRARWLKGGLAAVTAAVVGVIANLTLWFALHVLFAEGRLTIAALDLRALGLSTLALILLFRLKLGIMPMLGAMAAAGFALALI